MADVLTVKFEGGRELEEMLADMIEDFGEKDSKRILQTAVRKSMQPVLQTAMSLVRKDSGALAASLRIEARKPTNKDKKSVYVNNTDIVIGKVTIAPPNVLAKRKFVNLNSSPANTSAFNKKPIKQVGIKLDFRGIANEFGTAKLAAKPFLRPAMESGAPIVLNSLKDSLVSALQKYKSRKN
jgi:HK97 gp10 family phage protein